MATSNDLPLELWDKIIAYNREDNETLRAASLICRYFIKISQQYLFSEVTLAPPGSPNASHNDRSAPFRALLRRAPHIAFYVHHLKIVEGFHILSQQYCRNIYWIASSTTLHRVVRRLKNLVSLSITRRGRGVPFTRRLSWDMISVDLRNALLSACRSITSLTLKHVEGFNRPLLDASPNLKELNIGENACVLDRSVVASRTARPDALEVVADSSVLDWCFGSRSGLSLSSVQKLTIRKVESWARPEPIPYERILKLFHKCQATLEHLDCLIDHLEYASGLGVLKNLQSLNLRLNFTAPTNVLPDNLRHILLAVPDPNILREITVVIYYRVLIEKIPREGWDALDVMLTSPVFPHLQCFYLIISMNDIDHTYRPKTIPSFRPWLPRLHGKRALRVRQEKRTDSRPMGCGECR